MSFEKIPSKVLNFIAGEEVAASSGNFFTKLNPHDGKEICQVAKSSAADVQRAVEVAKAAQAAWADLPGVRRGEILFELVELMKNAREELAKIVALETGKSFKDALGETNGAIALAQFYAAEGQRLFGRTTTSGMANRHTILVREPVGIAGLIIAANTPIANVAWKTFPALICGNSALLKAAEDTPLTAWAFGKLVAKSSLPKGVFNIIQGTGAEAGAAIVSHPEISMISFTGSTAVGRIIGEVAGKRLAKVSLELGGKNPLVVCDDADLENAVKWTLLSAFSNAGQRCASGSRVLVFSSVYEKFRDLLVERAKALHVGPSDQDDYGPVINERQLTGILKAIEEAKAKGTKVLCGGTRLTGSQHANGFYLAPTLLEGAGVHDAISTTELFGPVACLYRVKDFNEALKLVNDSPYGLTASIHTTSIHRAKEFGKKAQAGVVIVNGGTYGSEPHMPFGGVKNSGNGSREPGPEAIDLYSNLKTIYEMVDPTKV